MPLLQVRGLEKRYGRRMVVSGVDYEVEIPPPPHLAFRRLPLRRRKARVT